VLAVLVDEGPLTSPMAQAGAKVDKVSHVPTPGVERGDLPPACAGSVHVAGVIYIPTRDDSRSLIAGSQVARAPANRMG